jgi:hypothetical protein
VKKRVFIFCVLLLGAGVLASAAPRPRPEIMGIALGMSHDTAQARLKSLGSLEKEERKRQEVWAIKDPRVSHLLVGYDLENRVRYVTAIARTDGTRIRYEEVADLKHAQQVHTQGVHKFTWEVAERRGQFAYVMTARGHDATYLDSYSVKKLGDEEID